MLIYPTIKMSPLLGLQGLGGGLGYLAGSGGLPEIGDEYEGGYFAGFISHTANNVATHGLIVAPAASGYNGKVKMQVKTSNDATTGTGDERDGAINTANMNNSSHPAAQYCAGLTIDGYSDWYLPSQYELEIIYWNLKPTTEGSSTAFGNNPYAVPAHSMDSSNPDQTTVSAFQRYNAAAEDFTTADAHWTSTQFGSSNENTHRQYFGNGAPGNTSTTYAGKTNSYYVRAIRKFAV